MTLDRTGQAGARRLALLLAVGLIFTAACTGDAIRRHYLRRNADALQAPPPRPAVIVPGFGVTKLYDPLKQRYVWGTPRTTVRTRYDDDLDLPIDAAGNIGRDRLVPRGYVGSRGPVNIGWHLMDALRRYGGYTPDVDVHPFYYDWRLGADENAKQLAVLIDGVRRGGKVDLITHSAGVLVALAYVKLHGGGENVEHLILISPTQRGVVDAFRVLVRPERFLRRRFTVEMVATWPAVTEILPEDGRFLVDEQGRSIDLDLWSRESWRALRLSIYRRSVTPGLERAFANSLAQARAFRNAIDATPMPRGIAVDVIAGDCVPTARRALVRSDGTIAFYPDELREGEKALADVLFEPGDGTVPISSARATSDAMLFCDGHQGIVGDPNVYRALIRILRESR